jgi:NAD(P)-dependent dehydrogenase (short-subunit alcohol dehydrogenase family)
MAQALAGKIAIVTGGSSGIGRGIVERFLAEGARVVIADINQEDGTALAANSGATFKKTDIANQAQVRALIDFAVQTLGGLHIMVNNAGISGAYPGRLLDQDFSDFERVMTVNLLGAMVGTRESARHMANHGGGAIINISSIGGIQAGPGFWAYGSSKAAMHHFTKSAAVDLGEYAIRVNCIAPSNIDTPIMGKAVGAQMSAEERAETMKKIRGFLISRQPLKLQGVPDDIAQAAIFFASDKSRYVTGTIMPVDGGAVAGNPSAASNFQDSVKRG